MGQEGEKIKERQEVLVAGETTDCPVCKKPLGEDGRQHLEDEYAQQLETMREQFRALQEKEKTVAGEEATLATSLRGDEHDLKRLTPLAKTIGRDRGGTQAGAGGGSGLPAVERERAKPGKATGGRFRTGT